MTRSFPFVLATTALLASLPTAASAGQPPAPATAARAAEPAETVSAPPSSYDTPPPETAPESVAPRGGDCATSGCDVACESCEEEKNCLECFLHSDRPLLADYRNVPLFGDDCDDCGDGGWTYSVGGEFRHRYMDERNRLRPQGTLRPSTYDLTRFTPFVEVGNDWIRGYVRGIDAQITGNDIPITVIDRNRWDLLEYYLDLKVGDVDGAPLRFRYGRQLLKYGDQHLVSPLGWANTFRNFEGFKAYLHGDTWDVDAFATQSVNGAAGGIFRPESFDKKDESRWFSGVYATYKDAPYGIVDLFWLWFNENEPLSNRQDGDRHTIGARYAGNYSVMECDTVHHSYFWDFSGGYQFGNDVFTGTAGGGPSEDVSAGFVNAKAGVNFDSMAWKPSVFGLVWWGSGDTDPNDGRNNTYNSLYPLGHAYWGLIDNFSGQNLLDYSVQASVKPMKKTTFVVAWHWFDKATTNDFVYNIVGAPLGPIGADKNIGNELDLVCTYQVNANLQVQAGYLMFFYGDAINNTALQRPDAKQFYLMTTLGF